MNKKIAAILLTLAMVLSACACSKDTDSTRTRRSETKAGDKADDDDDDDEDETKKTKKTKETTEEDPEETEKETEKETTTEEETTTTEEETTTTEETTEESTEETTDATTDDDDQKSKPTDDGTSEATTSFDWSSIGLGFDADSMNNNNASKWIKELQSEGYLVMDFGTYVQEGSFPEGTAGMCAMAKDLSKVYFYIEIAMNKSYTKDDLKKLAEQLSADGKMEVETKGDTLILTEKGEKIWGALDMKTGYFFISQNVNGDFQDDSETARKLGFNI